MGMGMIPREWEGIGTGSHSRTPLLETETVFEAAVEPEGCDLHHLISLMLRPSACQLSAVVPFRLLVLRLEQLTRRCHLRSVPVNLPAPFEDILIPLLLQHSLILLYLL